MKYLDDYRDPRAAEALLKQVRATATRPWTLMDATGGVRHLLRLGVDRALPAGLELVQGPGCPVCAMPESSVDRAVAIATRPDVIFCTSGDLLRVPGRRGTLQDAQGRADVRVVYSPLDALGLAKKNPERTVVFFAVGFETTAPAAAAAVREADRLGLANFTMLSAQVRMAPLLDALLAAPGRRVRAVIAAGHVGTVMGLREFGPLVRRHGVPVVVAGAEPVDLLEGILRAVVQLEGGAYELENQYERAVRPDGNPLARASIEAVFEPADVAWRGVGRLPACGLTLRERFRPFDADARFPDPDRGPGPTTLDLPCEKVVAGRLRPADCPAFGTRCTAVRPLGAPMASPEGTCAAYHAHARRPPDPLLDRPIHDIAPATSCSPRGA